MLLKSEYGNAFVNTNDPLKIEYYKAKGYTEVKVKKPATNKSKEPKGEK